MILKSQSIVVALLSFCTPATAAEVTVKDLSVLCAPQPTSAPLGSTEFWSPPVTLACRTYLRGIYEGIAEATKIDGTQILCPKQGMPDPAELAMIVRLAISELGPEYADHPAVRIAVAAFRVAEPCK